MANPSRLSDVLSAVSRSAPESQYIRAYHGSPYDWERVDMSMVGKGEGPLDEGFGFYASSSKGAGDWYRSRTTQIRRQAIADQIREMRAGLRADPNDPQWHSKYHRAIKIGPEIQDQFNRLQRQFPRGRSYELEIGVSPDSLLEYDLPIHAQRPEVLEKLRAVDPQLTDSLVAAGLEGLADEADGAMFYHTLSGGNRFDSPTIRGQRRASQMLFEAGIPGHAYQNNNRNYVFYPGTEDSIRILRKYGFLAPIAAGAAMGEE